MKCPKCGSDNIFVRDTRDIKNNRIRRRRDCPDCQYRFTTVEQQLDPRLDEYARPMTRFRKEMRIEIMKEIIKKVMETYQNELDELEGEEYGQE